MNNMKFCSINHAVNTCKYKYMLYLLVKNVKKNYQKVRFYQIFFKKCKEMYLDLYIEYWYTNCIDSKMFVSLSKLYIL